jgi:hypothetical protein
VVQFKLRATPEERLFPSSYQPIASIPEPSPRARNMRWLHNAGAIAHHLCIAAGESISVRLPPKPIKPLLLGAD